MTALTDGSPIPLGRAAEIAGGTLTGDPDLIIRGAAPFERAEPDQITFAAQPRLIKRLSETRAGAVIVPPKVDAADRPLIHADNPQVAFVRLLRHFHPPVRPGYLDGISPLAVVGGGFAAGRDSEIGPYAVIGEDVTFGDRVRIHPHVVIGDGVRIGDDVEVFPHVYLGPGTRIGRRVTIQAGSVIGADGYGYAPDGRRYQKIPHTGIVRIDDDVEIGAGNTIDRATYGETRIGRGVKTDNLVHVAHNVTVGEDTLLVAQVGIAGSARIGDHAVLAGQVGIAGHLTIGNDVTVGPQSGVGGDIPDGETVTGSPQMPHRIWLRVQRIIPRLPDIKKRLEALEKQLTGRES